VVDCVNVLEDIWVMLLEKSLLLSLVEFPDYITCEVLDFVIEAVP
jgi:hypothetical protein